MRPEEPEEHKFGEQDEQETIKGGREVMDGWEGRRQLTPGGCTVDEADEDLVLALQGVNKEVRGPEGRRKPTRRG